MVSSRRPISARRKRLHRVGLRLQASGAILFFLCFIGFAVSGVLAVESGGGTLSPVWFWLGCVIAIGLLVVGGGLRRVGSRGLAGSGLVLDPDRARDDLEPWARAGGGLLRDGLEASGLLDRGAAREGEAAPAIRIRCRACRALNDEDARFCDACGKPLG